MQTGGGDGEVDNISQPGITTIFQATPVEFDTALTRAAIVRRRGKVAMVVGCFVKGKHLIFEQVLPIKVPLGYGIACRL